MSTWRREQSALTFRSKHHQFVRLSCMEWGKALLRALFSRLWWALRISQVHTFSRQVAVPPYHAMSATNAGLIVSCFDLCQRIVSYYEGELNDFPRCNVRICEDSHRAGDCRVCSFVETALDQTSPSGSEPSNQSTIEIQASNFGTLYLNRSLSPDTRVYLLPLEPSPVSVSGRLMQHQYDFSLIRRWLQCCHAWHGHNCYTPGWLGRVTPLSKIKVRLIDVQQWCLVTAPPGCRYVALSYVWGTHTVLRTTRANLSALEKVDGFRQLREDIPRTILDAIEVVAKIGERYLWVDSLCIVQDDSKEKHEQIANMDATYGNAFLTINAAAGTDSQHGLPGVNPDSRDLSQLTLNCTNTRKVLAAQPTLTELSDASYWNTRAWTYQERFLSKRSLTFLENQVFFQCQRMVWCEDTVAEREDITDYHQMEDYLPMDWTVERNEHMHKIHYTLPSSKSTNSNWEEYLRVVEEYTPRKLTFDSDVLAAFAGMSKVLASMFQDPLLFGLPRSMFHCALLWHPAGELVRRVQANSSDSYIPSWSWAGWKGQIVHEDILFQLEMLSHNLVERTKPLVEWWHQTGDGSLKMVEGPTADEGRNILSIQGAALSPSFRPQHKHVAHLSGGMITGLVMSTMLHIRLEQDLTMETTLCFSLLDGYEIWCGSIWLDEKWTNRTAELYEFAVVSEGWTTQKQELRPPWRGEQWSEVHDDDGRAVYQFYNVFLLEREGDVAFRAGIGKIDKACWEALSSTVGEIRLA